MGRAGAKCLECDTDIWFNDYDIVPQAVTCICGATHLDEAGAVGNFVNLTAEELAELP